MNVKINSGCGFTVVTPPHICILQLGVKGTNILRCVIYRTRSTHVTSPIQYVHCASPIFGDLIQAVLYITQYYFTRTCAIQKIT